MRRILTSCLAALILTLRPGAPAPAAADAAKDAIERLAQRYARAAAKVNEDHARRPGKTAEPELAKRLPKDARDALGRLLQMRESPPLLDSLVACGEAALDLDSMDDFQRVSAFLEKASPEHARRLGTAFSRPRFLLRGLGGLDAAFLERFAEVLDAVLEAYDSVFGFKEWSKVPGKKLRVRLHLEKKAERGPHFAPQFPFHSEVDFPVEDGGRFRSPTADGKFLFYGLCHELGHVIAMWGDRQREEDHHAWAHYTGVAVVEHLARTAKDRPRPALEGISDVRWRSLEKERAGLKDKKPGTEDREGCLALFIALHDEVGPGAIGAAINHLDQLDRRLRVNRVRYYTFQELRDGLLATLKDTKSKQAVLSVFPPVSRAGKPRG